MSDFFDPPIEELNIALIDPPTARKAQAFILSCEHCSPEDAELPFDNILDRITGRDPTFTDYLLSEPVKCSRCRADVTEKTLVEFDAPE